MRGGGATLKPSIFLFERQSPSLAWNLPLRLGWLAYGPCGPAGFCLLGARMTNVLREARIVRTQVLVFTQQVL